MILKHLRFQHLKNHSDLFLVGKVFGVSWLSLRDCPRLQIGELLLDGRLCRSKLLKRQISGAPKRGSASSRYPSHLPRILLMATRNPGLTSWGRLVVEIPIFLQGIKITSQVVGLGISEPSTVFTLQRSTLKDATGSALLNLLAHLLLTLFQTTLVHLHIDFVIDLAWPNSFISFMRLRLSLWCC